MVVVLDIPLKCRQNRPYRLCPVRARLLRWQFEETKFLEQT